MAADAHRRQQVARGEQLVTEAGVDAENLLASITRRKSPSTICVSLVGAMQSPERRPSGSKYWFSGDSDGP